MDLWVTIPGNCATTRYYFPEIASKKYYFHKYFCEIERIFTNILEDDSRA